MNNKNKSIIKILNDVSATDIKLYDYEKQSPFFDYVIIATATDRQSNAAVSYMKKQDIVGFKNVEGRNNTGWVLIDAGDVIIHLFTEHERKVYKFDERLLSIKQVNIDTKKESKKSTKVNINNVSLLELVEIPGMTKNRANNILLHIKDNGPFTNTEDILEVKGIGPVTFQKVSPYITVK